MKDFKGQLWSGPAVLVEPGSRTERLRSEWMTFILGLILMIMWFNVGIDKYFHWETHYRAFLNQPLPKDWAIYLAYLLPFLELLLGLLLFFPKSRWFGFLCSSILLSSFSTYVGLVWIGAFPVVPCSCAGLFRRLLWGEHLLVNLAFLLISLIGIYQGHPTKEFKSIKT